jgi:hypothetical protein
MVYTWVNWYCHLGRNGRGGKGNSESFHEPPHPLLVWESDRPNRSCNFSSTMSQLHLPPAAGVSFLCCPVNCSICLYRWPARTSSFVHSLPLRHHEYAAILRYCFMQGEFWEINKNYKVYYRVESDRLCGPVVRVPGYRTEMYCASCEVRTECFFM